MHTLRQDADNPTPGVNGSLADSAHDTFAGAAVDKVPASLDKFSGNPGAVIEQVVFASGAGKDADGLRHLDFPPMLVRLKRVCIQQEPVITPVLAVVADLLARL